MPLEQRKGRSCRLLSQKYRESTAWYDTGRNPTKCKTPVIIELSQGQYKSVLINKENVEEAYEEPDTYEEAALQQHPDLDYKFDNLCKWLAECNIHGEEAIIAIFKAKLERANLIQTSKGNKAKWRHVDFFS